MKKTKTLFSLYYCCIYSAKAFSFHWNKNATTKTVSAIRQTSFHKTYHHTSSNDNNNHMMLEEEEEEEGDRRKWGVLERVIPTDHNNKNNSNNSGTKIFRLFMKDDGVFPNNDHHPLLIFQSSTWKNKSQKEGEDKIVNGNRWTSPWVWDVFSYHHYHSTAWELLLCVQGGATLLLGGDKPHGVTTEVSRGDVLLLPPGFVHKQLRSHGDFTLLGAYPTTTTTTTGGSSHTLDTVTGPPTTKQRQNIEKCLTPETDPILGYHIAGLY